MIFLRHVAAPLCLLTTAIAPWFASAQEMPIITRAERERDLSINARSHPEYDSPGIRAGNYLIRPSVTTGTEFVDNLYFVSDDAQSDIVLTVSPQVTFRSDLPLHEISGGASGEIARHVDIDAENYEDAEAWVGGRYDITGNTSIPLEVRFRRNHNRRNSPDDRLGIEPVVFNEARVQSGINYSGQLINANLAVTVSDLTFSDVQTTTGTIESRDRDRRETTAYGRVGSARDGVLSPFVYGRYRDVSYEFPELDAAFNRSAEDTEGGVGTLIDITGTTKASASIGYINREFDDASISNFSTIAFMADVNWEPSPLWAARLVGERDIRETALNDATAVVETVVELQGQYELEPNIYVRPAIIYAQRDFRGIREQILDEYGGNMNITYKMNRNLYLLADYRYIKQEEITVNRGGISLQLQF